MAHSQEKPLNTSAYNWNRIELQSSWLRGHRHLSEVWDVRLWVQSLALRASSFLTPDCKKINKAPSVRVIVICSEHRLLWRDSYQGVGHTSTSPDSILNKIIVISFCTWYGYIMNSTMSLGDSEQPFHFGNLARFWTIERVGEMPEHLVLQDGWTNQHVVQ